MRQIYDTFLIFLSIGRWIIDKIDQLADNLVRISFKISGIKFENRNKGSMESSKNVS